MATHIFIRHASTQVDPDNHPSTWVLTDKGKDQAKELINSYEWEKLNNPRLFVSTERKTRLTIENLAESLNLEIIESNLLNELIIDEFVEIEKFNEIRRNQFIQPDYHYNNIESSKEALNRILKFVEGLPEDQDTIITSHGTILSLYFGKLLGIEGEELYKNWKNLDFSAIGIVRKGEVVKSIF